jgi:hypothetical protein
LSDLPAAPASVEPYLQQAATGTKLPLSVVTAQNYTESGYQTGETSSAGAEGPWQFLVSTFESLGFNVSGINNWGISTQAYIKYMNELLAQEHGNVRDALAAYNAGPGNLAAGYGYADHILALAGQSGSITDNGGSSGSGTTGGDSANSTGAAGLLNLPSEITGFFKDGKTFVDALLWIVNPASWVRIGAFVAGLALLALAIYGLVMNNSGGSPIPKINPVPVPI